MNRPIEDTKLVTYTQLAELFQCTTRNLRYLVAAGKIPYFRLGKATIRFNIKDVLDALNPKEEAKD